MQKNRNRVLILEPHVSGHHAPYLEWMAKGLVARGFPVTIITLPESLDHPSLEGLARSAGNSQSEGLQIISDNTHLPIKNQGGIRGLIVRELAYWRVFRAWYKTHAGHVRPDIVFLPYLDYCLYAIGLLGSPFDECPWTGLAMRPSFHYQRMGVLAPRASLCVVKKLLFHRLFKNKYLRCLITIDEPLSVYLTLRNAPAERYAFLREPTELAPLEDSFAAKRQLGISEERKLILVYGSITERKGVLELIQALSRPDFPLNVEVLLAGKLSEGVKNFLTLPVNVDLISQGRLHLLDRFIHNDEESVLFAAADIVWLGYRQHYTPSGILVQAASAGRPVIACREGVIGWQAKRHNLGEVVDPADSEALIAAINAALKRKAIWTHEDLTEQPAICGSLGEAIGVLERALG